MWTGPLVKISVVRPAQNARVRDAVDLLLLLAGQMPQAHHGRLLDRHGKLHVPEHVLVLTTLHVDQVNRSHIVVGPVRGFHCIWQARGSTIVPP